MIDCSTLTTSPAVSLAEVLEVLAVATVWWAACKCGCGGEGSFLGTDVVVLTVSCVLDGRSGSILVISASELLFVVCVLKSL